MSSFVVAVDGPAGSGKSSVSRAAAAELGFAFLDTGASYRALTWLALERGLVGPEQADSAAVVELLSDFDYRIGTEPGGYQVEVAGHDVTEAIREPRVAAAVSQVARIPEVRAFMIELYRRIIAEANRTGIVVEGRDITTVVAPDAQLRVLLTASPEARAARRAAELGSTELTAAGEAIAKRDATDLQNVDFMNPAPGVVLLDTTELDFAGSIAALVALARSAGASNAN